MVIRVLVMRSCFNVVHMTLQKPLQDHFMLSLLMSLHSTDGFGCPPCNSITIYAAKFQMLTSQKEAVITLITFTYC